MIDVAAQIGVWEHYRALRAIRRRSWGAWIAKVVLVALPAIIVSLPAFFGGDVVIGLLRNGPLLLLLLLLLAAIPLAQLWAVWSHRRRTPSAQGVQNFRLDPAGFEVAGPLARTRVEWAAFLRVVETRDFFLFYFARHAAYLLPKRVLTPDQLAELRRDLPGWIGPRATVRSR